MSDSQWTYMDFKLPSPLASALLLVGQAYGQPDRVSDEDWAAAESLKDNLGDMYAEFTTTAEDSGMRETLVVVVDEATGAVAVEGQVGGGIGGLSELTAVLREMGVAYEMRDEGGIEWDAMMERWEPGMDKPFSSACTHYGEVVVDESAFDEIVKSTTTRKELIARLSDAYGGGGVSAPQVRCPSCGSTSGLATVEAVYYHAPIAIKDGEVVFTDESARVFWETSETQVSPDGNPLIHCHDCDHEWAEAGLREQLGPASEAAA